MSTKRPSKGSVPAKKHRKMMTLADKVQILDKLRHGASASILGREYNVNESTIRTIRKCEDKIRASIQVSSPLNARVCHVPRRDLLQEKMECSLSEWITEQMNQTGKEVEGSAIREKARTLYQNFVSDNQTDSCSRSEFRASKGWLCNFRKRFRKCTLLERQQPNISTEVEEPIHHKANAEFKKQFMGVVKSKGYHPEQVFTADEMVLLYRKLSGVAKSSADKLIDDKLTLLFCVNSSGDFKSKPFVVYHTENPAALRGKNKHQLPVVWRSNVLSLLTKSLITDWLHNCFVHQVKEYLISKQMDFKVLLIFDESRIHDSEMLQFCHPNIEVLFLPTSLVSSLQPMDQGIIKTFKCSYMKNILKKAQQATEAGAVANMNQFWKDFNIKDGIELIKISWDEMNPVMINSCWNNLWPKVVSDFRGFPSFENDITQIVAIVREIGDREFKLKYEQLVELLECDHESLEEQLNNNINNTHNSKEVETVFTAKNIQDFVCLMEKGAKFLVDVDPIMERSLKFKCDLEELLTPYKDILKDLKKKAKQKNAVGVPTKATQEVHVIKSTELSVAHTNGDAEIITVEHDDGWKVGSFSLMQF